MSTGNVTRRQFLKLSTAAGFTALLAACGGAASTTAPTTAPAAGGAATAAPAAATAAAPAQLPAAPAPGPIDAKTAGGLDALAEAAKKEGELSTIALPDDWANYGEVKKAFLAKYPFLKHNDLTPDASSAQEIEAIKANAGNSGPQNPDVVDVAFVFGDSSKKDGLFQPYKVATWDSIPASLKDPDGYWYADYYGVMTFEVNTAIVKNVPQDWADLLKPEYKGQIALAGDPTGSGQAINAVWAASLGNGGSLDDAGPGLEFFKKLNDAGNLLPVIAKPATIAKGETPIALRWDYNALANRDASAGNPEIAVVVPKSGSLAGVYVQAISAYSPRPNAARLWMEFLYSDEGQLLWLKGYASPARFDDLKKNNKIPADLLAKLPSTDVKIGIPSGDQITKATDAIKKGWPTIVGATVK
ncbi:MAG: extracellular solute-binding protein [Chloroflexi bacterium SZAS-1]|jgi:putative spermidine/putrescine transport system substrate-binding protein|nr:extracellular solute-binding protein [Chloroflexi bacterium SZAS-1]HNP86218.1 ABC transporter substrate-binding protein [Kouleothrix sp.]